MFFMQEEGQQIIPWVSSHVASLTQNSSLQHAIYEQYIYVCNTSILWYDYITSTRPLMDPLLKRHLASAIIRLLFALTELACAFFSVLFYFIVFLLKLFTLGLPHVRNIILRNAFIVNN